LPGQLLAAARPGILDERLGGSHDAPLDALRQATQALSAEGTNETV
jgi:hypothetical protein